MGNKKILIGIVCVIVIAAVLIWWNLPVTIINIAPAEVSMIEIFNGNTGNSIIITDTDDIEYIIANLNEITLDRGKISLGYAGYLYNVTVYESNGNKYKEFIINSKDTIRKDPLFYKVSSGSIDSEYIQNLFIVAGN